MAAAFSLAQELPEDAIVVISETEYTGAGKHIQPQLSFARDNGIDLRFGNPQEEDQPGENIIFPASPAMIKHQVADINRFRQSMIRRACKRSRRVTGKSDSGGHRISCSRDKDRRSLC